MQCKYNKKLRYIWFHSSNDIYVNIYVQRSIHGCFIRLLLTSFLSHSYGAAQKVKCVMAPDVLRLSFSVGN